MANTGLPAEDNRGFEAFRRLHRERLYRAVASVTGEPDTALEAVDTAMTQAAESWTVASGDAEMAGWVYRTALSKVHSLRSGSLPGGARHPDPAIRNAFAALPFRFRAVVVARFYLDWSPQEIATALRLPLRRVERRLDRALRRIQRETDEYR